MLIHIDDLKRNFCTYTNVEVKEDGNVSVVIVRIFLLSPHITSYMNVLFSA